MSSQEFTLTLNFDGFYDELRLINVCNKYFEAADLLLEKSLEDRRKFLKGMVLQGTMPSRLAQLMVKVVEESEIYKGEFDEIKSKFLQGGKTEGKVTTVCVPPVEPKFVMEINSTNPALKNMCYLLCSKTVYECNVFWMNHIAAYTPGSGNPISPYLQTSPKEFYELVDLKTMVVSAPAVEWLYNHIPVVLDSHKAKDWLNRLAYLKHAHMYKSEPFYRHVERDYEVGLDGIYHVAGIPIGNCSAMLDYLNGNCGGIDVAISSMPRLSKEEIMYLLSNLRITGKLPKKAGDALLEHLKLHHIHFAGPFAKDKETIEKIIRDAMNPDIEGFKQM